MESKLRHLEMIQGVINRMASNSFVFKGWSVTILAGLSAFATRDANKKLLLIAFFATLMLWAIDGFYLSLERKYREVYAKVAPKESADIDFSMVLGKYSKKRAWISAMLAPILLGFYGAAVVLIIGTVILIKIG